MLQSVGYFARPLCVSSMGPGGVRFSSGTPHISSLGTAMVRLCCIVTSRWRCRWTGAAVARAARYSPGRLLLRLQFAVRAFPASILPSTDSLPWRQNRMLGALVFPVGRADQPDRDGVDRCHRLSSRADKAWSCLTLLALRRCRRSPSLSWGDFLFAPPQVAACGRGRDFSAAARPTIWHRSVRQVRRARGLRHQPEAFAGSGHGGTPAFCQGVRVSRSESTCPDVRSTGWSWRCCSAASGTLTGPIVGASRSFATFAADRRRRCGGLEYQRALLGILICRCVLAFPQRDRPARFPHMSAQG